MLYWAALKIKSIATAHSFQRNVLDAATATGPPLSCSGVIMGGVGGGTEAPSTGGEIVIVVALFELCTREDGHAHDQEGSRKPGSGNLASGYYVGVREDSVHLVYTHFSVGSVLTNNAQRS